MTIDLYTTSDLKKVREKIQKEQNYCCKITGLTLTRAVLDHSHDDNQLCRGVIESTLNVFVGVIERGYLRYIKHWCTIPLPELLRLIATYLESSKSEDRYRHKFWLKKCQTEFNKLPEASKASVLSSLGQVNGRNGKERKDLFRKALMSREHTFEDVIGLIHSNLPKQ